MLPEIPVPGDFSSAAPFIAAATILQGSNLTLRDVSINPTRTGMLAVLERMGARVGLFGRRWAAASRWPTSRCARPSWWPPTSSLRSCRR